MKNTFFTMAAVFFITAPTANAKVSHLQNIDAGCNAISRTAAAQSMSTQDLLADGNLSISFNEDKSVKGVQFTHVMKCGLFESMGVRSGDILLEVNGIQVNSPTSLMIFFNRLRTMSPFLIKLERAGQTGTVTVK